MGDTAVYHQGLLKHGPLANSTLLYSYRNYSNIQVCYNLVFDNPQVQGIATIFEGRVFNPNLLIRHKGSKEYSQVLAVELSIQPHLKDLISAAKYLVEKQYGSNGNGGKSNSSSFVVIVTVATVK